MKNLKVSIKPINYSEGDKLDLNGSEPAGCYSMKSIYSCSELIPYSFNTQNYSFSNGCMASNSTTSCDCFNMVATV